MKQISLPSSLTSIAHQRIKEYILLGNLKQNERVTEDYFAGQLGISKSPIREALNRLEAEGLIRIEPRRGAYLRTFDVKGVTDLYDLREALETHAVLTATITPPIVARLQRSVNAILEQHASRHKGGYIKHDISFHSTIAEATGNDQLIKAYENLQDRVHLLRLKSYDLSSDKGAYFHKDILDCLVADDRPAAVALMREHIRSTRDQLCARIAAETEKVNAESEKH